MGVKISQRYSSYKSQPKAFKRFLNFLPNGPRKTTIETLETLNIEILTSFFSFSLTWDPMGANISKCYSSYKSQPKVLKVILNFPPNGPHEILFGIFEMFKFFFEKFTIVAYGEIKNLNYVENERL